LKQGAPNSYSYLYSGKELNRHIKKVGQLAGINTPIKASYIKGNQDIVTTKPRSHPKKPAKRFSKSGKGEVKCTLVNSAKQPFLVDLNDVFAMNIHRFPKHIIIIIAFSALASCKEKGFGRPAKNDSLVLKISFHPAFAEWSEAILKRSAAEKSIQILLRDQLRADRNQDTFWFKKVYLSDRKFSTLVSALIVSCRQKISRKSTLKGVDGMTINTQLTFGGDTNFTHFWSPQRNEDSVGYRFTDSLLTTLKRNFQNTIASEYFGDLEEYIDASKRHAADSKRKIDRLRMEKYGWKIRKTVSR
jgi:hypothetical protein